MTDNILEVRHLSTHFFTRAGPVKAADDISFEIKTGSTLALLPANLTSIRDHVFKTLIGIERQKKVAMA